MLGSGPELRVVRLPSVSFGRIPLNPPPDFIKLLVLACYPIGYLLDTARLKDRK